MKYRKQVTSTIKQPQFEYLQNGILVRWDFKEVTLTNGFEDTQSTQWQYKELWAEPDTTADQLEEHLNKIDEYHQTIIENYQTWKNK